MLYIVMKAGVYLRGIIGVFDNGRAAAFAAEEFLKKEHDAYHRVMVFMVELNREYRPVLERDDCYSEPHAIFEKLADGRIVSLLPLPLRKPK